MMKSILRIALLLALTAGTAQAQVDVTASAGTASASYTTLKAAFDAVNAGVHQGVIGIAISGNTAETATASLLASGGTSSYTQITVQPQGGAARTVTGTIAGALVELNGADNVTIDGLNSGGDALTLANTSTGATASALRFVNDATGNTIQNCSLQASGAAVTTGVVAFSTTTGAGGNDNNVVTACDIGPAGASLPYVGVFSQGSTGTAAAYNSSNTISNNRIHDFFAATASAYGIEVLTGNSDWTISGNSVYQTATRTPTAVGTIYGIYVSNGTNGNNFGVTGNFVGGSAASAGGGPWTWSSPAVAYAFTGIYTSATTASIQGNTIANIAWTANGIWRGIQAPAGTINIGTVTGNTIGAPTGTGSIVLASATSVNEYGIDVGGNGVMTVSNNSVGSLTGTGNLINLIGVNSTVGASGLGSGTISANLIGSLTTPSSIAVTTGTATTGQVTGIVLGGNPTTAGLTVSGNTIANLSSAAVSAGSRSVHGINVNTVSFAYFTIIGNTIRNLSSSATGTSIAPNAVPIAGIGVTMTAGTATVTQNTIYALSSTTVAGSANVEGIGIATSTPANGSAVITRNFVHSLSAASSAACNLYGIAHYSGGAVRYANNMVRLGVDASGAAVTGPGIVAGMGADATSSYVSGGVAYYSNTVWIGGSVASGAYNSYAFYRGATAWVDTLKNNILIDVRTGGTGKHFAASYNGSIAKVSDYNIYWTGGTANVLSTDNGATAFSTLQALRGTLAGWDMNSGLGDPQLVAPAGDAATVSLKLQSSTAAEGTGIDIPAFPDDREGDLRSANTPADVGADAGLYTAAGAPDVFPPVISMTPLANTSLVTDRTFTALVTDNAPTGAGVPTGGPLVPRVWYKKSTDLGWTLSGPGTLLSGSATNGTWSFTIAAAGLAPAPGDVIQYYLVAQDQAASPNLWYLPFAASNPMHSDVSTQLTPPAAPMSYTITVSLAGTYYAPNDPGGQAARTYPSITGPGGFFAAINFSALSGDVTLLINGDLTETGANKLAQWSEDGAGGYSLAIRPDAAALHTIAGTAVAASTPMIDFNGADRVTVDGSFSGSGQYLLFRNTNATPASAGAAIQFNNSATGDALLNCIVESNATTATTGAVVLGATGANTGFTLSGSDVRDASLGTVGPPANAVYGSSALNASLTISNNALRNWTAGGVALPNAGSAVTVSGNSFFWNRGTAAATTQTAISIGGAGDGHVISGNFIGGSAPLCGGSAWPNTGAGVFTGISVSASGAATGSSIQGNTVQNLLLSGSGASFTGIVTSNGRAAIGTTSGNTIGHASTAGSIVLSGISGAVLARGISFTSAANPAEVSNNTIGNIGATSTGASALSFRGIDLNATAAAVSAQNNTIKSIALSGTGAGAFAGLYASTVGALDLGGTTGNTVSGISLAGSGASYGLYAVTTAGGPTVSQNTVTGVTGTGSAPFFGIHVGWPYTASAGHIVQNVVRSVSMSGTGAGAEFRGVSVVGNPTPGNGCGPAIITGNVVGDDAASNNILNAGGGATTGFYVEGYNNSITNFVDLSNSTVANVTASGTGSGVSLRGIYTSQPSYAGLTNCSVHDLQSASSSSNDGVTAALAGIVLQGAQTPMIQGASVHGLRGNASAGSAAVVDGIYVNGGIGVAQRNRVWDLSNTAGGAGAAIRGVYQYGGNWTLANNQLSITNAPNDRAQSSWPASTRTSRSRSAPRTCTSIPSSSAGRRAVARPTPTRSCAGQLREPVNDNLLYNERANTGSSSGSHYAVGTSLGGTWSATTTSWPHRTARSSVSGWAATRPWRAGARPRAATRAHSVS